MQGGTLEMGLTLTKQEERPDCPEVIRKRARDEYYDACKINDMRCLHQDGYRCDTYEAWLSNKKKKEKDD